MVWRAGDIVFKTEDVQEMSEFILNNVLFYFASTFGEIPLEICDEILKRKDKLSIAKYNSYFLMQGITFIARLLECPNDAENSIILQDNVRDVFSNIYSSGTYTNIFLLTDKYPEIIINNFPILLEYNGFPDALKEIIDSRLNRTCFTQFADLILNRTLEELEDHRYDAYTGFLCFEYFLEVVEEDFIEKHEDKIVQALTLFMRKNKPESFDRGIMENESNDDLENIVNGLGAGAKKSKKINQLLEDNKNYIVSLFTGISIDDLKKYGLLDYYIKIIEDIRRNEGVDFSAMSCRCGGTANVLIIGDKAIKTGFRDGRPDLPYDKRILQPIKIDRDIPTVYRAGKKIFLEIYERVDTKNITEEDAYEIFKELLQRNILWADPKARNLGRLIKPNIRHLDNASAGFKEENSYVDGDKIRIQSNYNDNEILGPGELVICDLQYIYSIAGFDIDSVIEEEFNKDSDFSFDVITNTLKEKYFVEVSDYNTVLNRYINEVKERLQNKAK